MPSEYERRFLVPDVHRVAHLDLSAGHELIVQGYFVERGGAALRIRRRLVMHGSTNQLLVEAPAVMEYKGPRHSNHRLEQQWPVEDVWAPKLMALCTAIVQKRRYSVITDDGIWEIDVFLRNNAGLVIAELESETPRPALAAPTWCGPDIGGARAFDNEQLAFEPISTWPRGRLNEYSIRYRPEEF